MRCWWRGKGRRGAEAWGWLVTEHRALLAAEQRKKRGSAYERVCGVMRVVCVNKVSFFFITGAITRIIEK